jgi:hypothetical protein
VHNDTDTPEQLQYHGQMVPVNVDGASEEGTTVRSCARKRRNVFTQDGGLPLLSHPQQGKTFHESEVASSSALRLFGVHGLVRLKVLDTADIVREAILQQLAPMMRSRTGVFG